MKRHHLVAKKLEGGESTGGSVDAGLLKIKNFQSGSASWTGGAVMIQFNSPFSDTNYMLQFSVEGYRFTGGINVQYKTSTYFQVGISSSTGQAGDGSTGGIIYWQAYELA